MLLESANATTKRVEEFLEKIHTGSIKPESQICIDDHFTGWYLMLSSRGNKK